MPLMPPPSRDTGLVRRHAALHVNIIVPPGRGGSRFGVIRFVYISRKADQPHSGTKNRIHRALRRRPC
jgi:hypothetical protein